MQVTVRTPSRLHFSLIDLHGGLGRIDGGIGVALETPHITLRIQTSPNQFSVRGISEDLIRTLIHNFFKNLNGITGFEARKPEELGIQLDIINKIPSHVGLGSRTQLSLALGMALTRIMQLDYPISVVAKGMNRGGTSGIGVATFDQGGFIFDGGHSYGPGRQKLQFTPSRVAQAPPAPVILQKKMPRDWLFVIVLPEIGKGAYGAREVDIFQKYCPIPEQEVERLSRIIVMQLLPGLIEKDIQTFGSALTAIQQVGFKRIEIELQQTIIKDLMDIALKSGAAGVGMSSFGPTTYALVSSNREANNVINSMKIALDAEKIAGQFFITHVNNIGASIEVEK